MSNTCFGGATRDYEIQPIRRGERQKSPPKPRKVIILEGYDFAWTAAQMGEFVRLWREGMSLPEIAQALKRKQVEALLLQVHLELEGQIKPRKGGIMGGDALSSVKI